MQLSFFKSQKLWLTLSIFSFLLISLGIFFNFRLHSLFITPAPENFVHNSPAQSDIDLQPQVLGTNDGSLSFATDHGNYGSNGGVLVIGVNTSPQVKINSYSVSGTGTLKVYRVNKSELINYLLYKKTSNEVWGASLEKIYKINTGNLQLENTLQQPLTSLVNQQSTTPIELPISGTGVWFLELDVNGKRAETMVVRSNLTAIDHEGDNQNIFWVQDNTYQSVADAKVELLNLENSLTSVGELTTNPEGIATSTFNDALDLAMVSKGEDFTLVPVNLTSLNYRSGVGRYNSGFSRRVTATKSFFFTDRFLYKPGDTVNFKAVIREEDDADYSIDPQTYNVIFGLTEEPTWARTMTVSSLGTIDGTIPIPADAEPGYYSLYIKDGENYIASMGVYVANFRKPDSQVSIETNKLAYLPGEKVVAQIKGENFFGRPIKNQNVRYKIYQFKATLPGSYEELKFAQRLEFSNPDQATLQEGEVTLDNKGHAQLELKAENTTGFRQFWVIKLEYLDAGKTATNDVIQVLIQPGDFVIEKRAEPSQTVVGQPITFPLKLSPNKPDAKLSNMKVLAKLMVSNNAGGYQLEQDGLEATSDASGLFDLLVTPKMERGYKIELQTNDSLGNPIKGEEVFYASSPANAPKNEDIFEVTLDKKNYDVGDTARVAIKTRPEIKNIFVSLGREYSRKYQVLPVSNGTASLEVAIPEKYQPNFFIFSGSFWQNSWLTDQTKVSVNTVDKKISVSIKPSQMTYGPAETANFEIYATDGLGRPVQTDLAFWIFDKALLELHGAYFTGIFDRFWSERWFNIRTNHSFQGISSSGAEGGGGCFAGETLVTMADGSLRRIDQIKAGESIQTYLSVDSREKVSAKVLNTHEVSVPGFLIINKTLKVTPEHRLFINHEWKTAGEITLGDYLLNSQGQKEIVTSIEWLQSKTQVYNLTIEKFQTYFANNVYVHNEKGDSRSIFKDTAYWNPHVTTGVDGKATVSVPLPDNLTTWVTAAVAANSNTQVGEGQAEFIVTKDVIVRPIAPSFLRNGDQLFLSALLSNFTAHKEKFTVTAEFSGGEIANPRSQVEVDSEEFEELAWPIRVTQEDTQATFKVKALGIDTTSLIDEVTEKIPLFRYGSWQTKFQTTSSTGTVPANLSNGTDTALAKVELKLSTQRYPQLSEMLTTLMGRVSNNTPRDAAAALVAASLVAQHGEELGLTYSKAALNQTALKAVEVLKSARTPEGVWLRNANVFDASQTRFMIEALVQAKAAGLAIDQEVLDKALNYFVHLSPSGVTQKVEQQYVFSLFPKNSLNRIPINVPELSNPTEIALATLANQRQGFLKSTAEMAALLNLAQETPTQFSWYYDTETGQNWREIAHPTAWAARALLELDGDISKIEKSLDYLFRNRANDPELSAVQVLAGLQYYEITDQLKPNYSYTVSLDGQALGQGQVSKMSQVLPATLLEAQKLKENSQLSITQDGPGGLFGSLEIVEFFNSREVTHQENNIALTRKYLSTKGEGEPVIIGDLVIVQFEVAGLGRGETEMEIEDYLPSGLVAIDENLDNGTFDPNGTNSSYAQQNLTEQGMRLSINQQLSDQGIFSYKTRVISQGEFDAPPATVKLINQPAIWSRTSADRLIIDGKHSLEVISGTNQPATTIFQTNQERTIFKILVAILIVIITLIIGSLVWIKRLQLQTLLQRIRNVKKTPPPELPPQPSSP